MYVNSNHICVPIGRVIFNCVSKILCFFIEFEFHNNMKLAEIIVYKLLENNTCLQ
jgi:hypothetical protein